MDEDQSADNKDSWARNNGSTPKRNVNKAVKTARNNQTVTSTTSTVTTSTSVVNGILTPEQESGNGRLESCEMNYCFSLQLFFTYIFHFWCSDEKNSLVSSYSDLSWVIIFRQISRNGDLRDYYTFWYVSLSFFQSYGTLILPYHILYVLLSWKQEPYWFLVSGDNNEYQRYKY